MTEKIYKFSDNSQKVIEPVIKDDNLHYMHMVLPKGEGLPVHTTNANVYMTVVSGELSISLAGSEFNIYPERTVLKIPQGIEMNAKNNGEKTLELIVVKSPAPKN
jgi:quercetin dioxygenase-like cupin family protein